MSWIQKLFETYELCADRPQFANKPFMPISHTEQQAHIEIILDESGNFQRAALVDKETTVVPATEKSAGRTIKATPHALCDKIQYCAADYKEFGGKKEFCFEEYIKQLRDWTSKDSNPKAQSVLNYVEKATVVADLVREGILHCGADKLLLTEWTSESPTPGIFKLLTAKKGERDQGDAFVRWRVQIPGVDMSSVWEDTAVRDSWIRFNASQQSDLGLCMVTGEATVLAASHPKRIRHGADGAKLISSNDETGYTFRGRFEIADQAYGLGSAVSQKAHSALRWLIQRQGSKGEQAFVSWAINGKSVPDPLANTSNLFASEEANNLPQEDLSYQGDVGQHFALRLKKAISGYRAKLSGADEICVIGLDSATPGRMAIIYYRELTAGEFLDRLADWHARCAWPQNYSKDNQYVGAPAPKEIADAAYGRRLDDKLRKATVERLLPCIIDGRPLPRDLVDACIHRVWNRVGLEKWEWEKYLGIACALVRGSSNKEDYKMSLEENRTTRDYLYGRLLAIADNIEHRALRLAKEERDTGAAKLMQRFANHPCSTWRNIELALAPYQSRLRSKRPSVLLEREKLLDEVIGKFNGEDFFSDSKLSGEFLLGFHCQRAALWAKKDTGGSLPEQDESTVEGETV